MSLLEPGSTVARYTILGPVASGGMAEIYAARQVGPGDFSKNVALKVILPNLAEDDEFLQMFYNEAKLAALLNHPNVVQVFDFGVDDDTHYIAMEHLDGCSLVRIMRALYEQRRGLPIPIALRIIADACSGLDYAHNVRSSDGRSLEVIHRDVSLENIIVTYSGQVKLVDFGIAKARILVSHTKVGTIKGKYSYMAPEMLRGEKIDHRVDIFSAGVVMYRLLTGRAPFPTDDTNKLFELVCNSDAPRPRDLVPQLPEAADEVIRRSMARDRERRYQRARDLQIAIEQYLSRAGTTVGPYQLAEFMRDLFPDGTDEQRERFRKLTRAVPAPMIARRRRAPSEATAVVAEVSIDDGPPTDVRPPFRGRPDRVARVDDEVPTQPGEPDETRPGDDGDTSPDGSYDKEQALTDAHGIIAVPDVSAQTERSTAPVSVPVVTIELGLGDLGLAEPGADGRSQGGAAVDPADMHRQATQISGVLVDGRGAEPGPGADGRLPPLAGPPRPFSLPELALAHWRAMTPARQRQALVGVGVGGLVLAVLGIVLLLVNGGSPPSAPRTSEVIVVSGPSDAVDGAAAQRRGPDAGARPRAAVSPSRPGPGPRPAAAPGKPAVPPAPSAGMTPPARAVERGYLSVQARRPAVVYLDGTRLGMVPLSRFAVTPGAHRIAVYGSRPRYGMRRAVTVKPGAHERLDLTPKNGTMELRIRPWATVTLNGRKLGNTPLPPLSLLEGRHNLLLENSALGARVTRKVTIEPGERTVVKVRLTR